jgi:hypothetical protein
MEVDLPASRPCRLTPREITPDTHRVGGYLNPRDGLDTVEKKKILPCRE